MFEFRDDYDDPPFPHAVCSICGNTYPGFLLARHMAAMHPVGVEDDVLSTYDRMHPDSASAKFAALIREAAERGAK